jgi:hypothetical protein
MKMGLEIVMHHVITALAPVNSNVHLAQLQTLWIASGSAVTVQVTVIFAAQVLFAQYVDQRIVLVQINA